ncbi:uncharacterized protein LOC130048352 isoform X2 [Ostrea edulis]|nr:uncharacterized protein LOC130048352 isoform X2 [Ostrea edulis]
MSPGFCFVVADNGRITNENCSSFIDNQCQMSYDDISSIYRYPACLSINPKHGCYTSDPDCPDPVEIDSSEASETTTAEDRNTALIAIVILVPVVVGGGVITSVLIYCFCYKRKRNKPRNKESPEEIGLLETLRLNDGGVTVDINENGIKFCVSLSNGSSTISSIIWKKNDSMIEIDINTRKYSRGESGQHRYLVIHDVNHDDRGQYSCFVTSETGKESETVVFNLDAVNVELDFISSIPLGEIRCARLTATFTSSEILETMWLKRDGNTTKSIKVDYEKYSESTYSSRQEMHLFIHDVNESDAGSYWVIVKTTSGIGISRPGTLDVLHDNKESLYEEWEKENDHFVSWSASSHVIESLQNNNIVIITGEQGSGKSAIIHNVAVHLKSRSCKIVFVSHLKDIIACWQSEDNKVCYIIEDPFGKTVLDISKLFHYLSIAPRIQNSKQVKLLMAVSLPVYKKICQIESIASCIDTVNLSCEQYDEEEKAKIFQLTEVPADLQKQMAAKENFPFLCYLYANEGFECQNDQGTNFTAEYEKHIAEKISRNHRDVVPNILAWMVLCIFNNNVLNSISFQNAAIVEWMGKNANGQLREAFESPGSTRTYLERSIYGDSVFTIKRDKVLEVVVGLLKQMNKGLSQLRHIPPMFFGLFLRKLELPKSVDIFFNVNCVNLCEIFESDDMIHFLEQIPLTGDIPMDDLKRVFLSESVYDIVNAWGSDPCGEVDLSRQNVELYGYTLLFSFTLTHNNMRKILKTKVLWWVAKFGSIRLLKNILDIINSDEFSEELKRLLELSCFSNSKDKLELILERREMYGTPDEDRVIFEVPVKIAFFRKSETLLGFLNEKGAKLDNIEIDGKTLLSASIHDRQEDGEVDDLQFTKFLAKKMKDINKEDRNGKTALLIAKEKGDNKLVKMLPGQKANVNKCGPRNRTPLFVAAEKDQYQILKELLRHEARIDSYDANGRSSLHEAARRGHIKIVQHLVKRGANVNKPDIDKKTPLHLAVEENRYEVAEFLVSKNSNIDSLDKLCQSPLYIAAKLGLDQILELLINKGGDVNICNKDWKTPLHVAAHLKNTKIVKQLLEGKAKVNMKDKDSNLALHLATREGKLDIVKLLLKKNADVNVVNNQDESPLFLACSNGNYDIVKELVKSEASVNIRNIEYYTSLHAASEKNLIEIVEYLVTKGATINANDKTNKTPLYCACERGNTNVIRYLLKNGANVHLCDEHNVTPLILVSKTGQLENVKLIVEHLDDPKQINRCDNERKSALHHACSEHSQDVVKYLKKNHADLTLRDAEGCTPIDIARENDFDDLVDILSTWKRYF